MGSLLLCLLLVETLLVLVLVKMIVCGVVVWI